jgi:hypothetical protein
MRREGEIICKPFGLFFWVFQIPGKEEQRGREYAIWLRPKVVDIRNRLSYFAM